MSFDCYVGSGSYKNIKFDIFISKVFQFNKTYNIMDKKIERGNL